jgi:TM2 domain-containing membrane protein YozV
MKISTRAALYSGLIIPGLGQLYLGSRKKGFAIALCVIGLVVWLAVRLFALVYDVLIGEGSPEAVFFNLNEATVAQIHTLAYKQNLWLLILIIALWLYSIFDAYRVGKKWDKYYEQVAQSPVKDQDQGASSKDRN